MNARTTLPNEEREVDPNAAARLPAILHPPVEHGPLYAEAPAQPNARGNPLASTRKQRSDAGTKRVKEPEPTGTLSAAQLDTLRNLMRAREVAIELAAQASEAATEATKVMREAGERLSAFMESLRAK